MKILHKKIDKGGEGQVAFIAEESDDLWLIYNIIQKHDQIRGSTFRKIVNESATGSTGAYKVKLTLTLSVEKVEYELESDIVKVKGRSIIEHKHVRKGQYHTLDLELNKKFYLTKPVWDSLALAQLHNTHELTMKLSPEVAVVIMQEGLAHVCMLTTNLTVEKAKVECNIARKRKNFCSQHQRSLEDFYEQTLQAMVRHINIETIKCVLIASPGFVKDQFAAYMWPRLAKLELRSWLDARGKLVLAHSSTGYKHSIGEVLADKQVQTRLEDTKAVQDLRVWDEFKRLLAAPLGSGQLAVYGLREVEMALEFKAARAIMLSDGLFRSGDLSLRKRYGQLMAKSRALKCPAHILSSMHLAGQQLSQLGGLAAILRFRVPEIEELTGVGAALTGDRHAGAEQGDDDDDADGSRWSSSGDQDDDTTDDEDDDDGDNCDDSMMPKSSLDSQFKSNLHLSSCDSDSNDADDSMI